MYEFEGHQPQLSDKCWIHDSSVVLGDVTLADFVSIWPHCTLRGDVDLIKLGRYTNLQDSSVVHVAEGFPSLVGDYVTIGHRALIHGAVVEDNCLIGMGAILLTGSRIGTGSIVGAGALVKEGQIIPPHSLVVGSPARVVREVPDRLDGIHNHALRYAALWAHRWGIAPNAELEPITGPGMD